MTRLVLDTDVLVAALRSPGGASAEVLRLVHAGRLSMLASVALFTEYESVVMRPEHRQGFDQSATSISRVLDELAERVVRVDIWYQWRPQLRDPADEMVLEAAVNGRADYLLSFNRRDFADAPARFGLMLAAPGPFLRSLRP